MQNFTTYRPGLASLLQKVICTSVRWLPGVFALILFLPGLVLAQGTNISFPSFRSSFISGTDVPIIATASSLTGTTISKVEFLLSSAATAPATTTVVLGEDLTSPYSLTWIIPAGQPSYNELRTRVTYANGVTAVSSSVPVDVYEPTISSNVNYYVAPPPLGTTAPANNGTNPSAPWSTIQGAMSLAKPGDIINVMAGTYTANNSNVVAFRRTGTPTHWVTLKNYQNDRPVISANGPNAILVTQNVAYARIQGLEIVGSNSNEPLSVTLPKAYTQAGSCVVPTGTPPNIYNTNGISIDGRNAGNIHPHHIVVSNNIVHDCGGSGISGIQCDYVTFENNTSYNNSWFTVYGTSGINILNAWNYDSHPGMEPNIIIRNNISYNNRLYVRWRNGSANTCRTYDGNGIILDNNRSNNPTIPSQVKNPLGDYTGRFLIENNLCSLNGGRGININYTDNVTIRNNTTYQNGATNTVNSPATGEVTDDIQSELIALGSSAINVYNNIFYGRAGEKTIDISNSTNISHNNNLTFEGTGTSFFTGNQNITGQDPLFQDAATRNFQLQANSPAINVGSNQPGQFSQKDILGIDRPQGSGVDMGAYEIQATPLAITQQPASGSTVCVGASVSTSVGVTGTVTGYQWYKDGVLLNGQTAATLSLTTVQLGNAGSYSVVVSGINSLTSDAFSLTINQISFAAAPSLLPGTVAPGGSLTLGFTASGTDCSFPPAGPFVVELTTTPTPTTLVVTGTSSQSLVATVPVNLSAGSYQLRIGYNNAVFSPYTTLLIDVPLSISANQTALCVGGKVLLEAIGCQTGDVHWSTGETGRTIEIIPQSTTAISASCVVATGAPRQATPTVEQMKTRQKTAANRPPSSDALKPALNGNE